MVKTKLQNISWSNEQRLAFSRNNGFHTESLIRDQWYKSYLPFRYEYVFCFNRTTH